MNDKQIEEKLQEIETANPDRFKQYKLRAHLHWAPVEGASKLIWGFHHSFLGNLPSNVKVEVSKLMNKLSKSGYDSGKVEATEKVEVTEKTEE